MEKELRPIVLVNGCWVNTLEWGYSLDFGAYESWWFNTTTYRVITNEFFAVLRDGTKKWWRFDAEKSYTDYPSEPNRRARKHIVGAVPIDK